MSGPPSTLSPLKFLKDLESVFLGNTEKSMWPPCFQLSPNTYGHATITQLATYEYSTARQPAQLKAFSTVTAVMSWNIWETSFVICVSLCMHGQQGLGEVTFPASPTLLLNLRVGSGMRCAWANIPTYMHHHHLICQARGTGVTGNTEPLMACCTKKSGSNDWDTASRTLKQKHLDVQPHSSLFPSFSRHEPTVGLKMFVINLFRSCD